MLSPKKIYCILTLLFVSLNLIAGLPLSAQEENLTVQAETVPAESNQATSLKEKVSSLAENLQGVGGVQNVKTDIIEDAKGLAIFLPQIHKDPTTSTNDPSNNNAVTVQRELYDVIKDLTKTDEINLIMTEGELYGRVPEDKLSKLKDKIVANEKLEESLSELEDLKSSNNLNPNLLNNVITEIKNIKETTGREISLIEAPYKIKNEDDSIILYGSENQDTYQKSAELVRKYVYLQDRLNQLFSNQSMNNFSHQMSPGPIQTLGYPTNLTASLTELKKQGEINKNTEVVSACEHATEAVNELAEREVAQNSPSRANNPYQAINNAYQLQTMLAQTENEINQVVIKDRNHETATNFTQTLLIEQTNIGILQFGAGHTDGLINELNQSGISVITVQVESLD